MICYSNSFNYQKLSILGRLPKIGTATQSSVDAQRNATLAVDGNYANHINYCTHTSNIQIPPAYLEYMLPYKFAAESVEIFNRMDCCTERLSNVDVYIVNATGLTLCGNTGNMDGVSNKRIYCDKIINGIGIRVVNKRTALNICELDIYGRKFAP